MGDQFQVKKAQLDAWRIVDVPGTPLREGDIRLAVDTFAFTTNNVTYGVAGDSLGYWLFYPPADDESGEWGVIPVWGLADVVESKNPAVPVGERLWGYFPPGATVDMSPKDITPGALTESAERRQKLSIFYNRYKRVLADPAYDKANDPALMLLGPLHMTAYCLWDYLKRKDWFGAEQILVISASSKTALGLAVGLAEDAAAPGAVALTSPRNADFVSSLKLYDTTVPYDAISSDLPRKPSVVVDMAGNAELRAALAARLGDDLRYSIGVGITHRDKMGGGGLAADDGRSEFFFVPSYIEERIAELGPAEFDARASAYVAKAAKATFGWMTVDTRQGLQGLAEAYPQFCDGSYPPTSGLVIKM